MELEGISSRPLWQPFVTTSGMIGVINSFLVGVFVGFVAGVAGARLALAVPLGAAFSAVAIVAHLRRQRRAWGLLWPHRGTP